MASRLFNIVQPSVVKVSGYGGTGSRWCFNRSFATNNPGFQKYTTRVGGVIPNAGLLEEHPGLPALKEGPSGPATTATTTLSNGVRVVTISSPTLPSIATLGVYVTSGSRHETRQNAGSTHFLKQLAFASTQSRPSIQLVRDIETLGATFSATASREHILFESEVLAENAPQMLNILGDVLHPRIAYHEVERQKPHIEEEVEHLTHDPVTSLFEILHREAFRHQGLGQPLTAPKYNIEHINYQNLATYVNTHYTPQNTIVVAVGIPHSEVVPLVQRSFEGLIKPNDIPKVPSSDYTGGEAIIPNGGDTHIALAFEGISITNQKDSIILSVLQNLLGGGSQYTRDGPGAGLLSRLNTNLISSNKNIKAALSFNLPYSDTGLFGVYAQVSDGVPFALSLLVKEVASLLSHSSVDSAQLSRAKISLKYNILSAKRLDTLHFIGQQALGGAATIITPEQYSAIVDSVTLDDVKRVAQRVLTTPPTLVVLGDVAAIPHVGSIRAAFTQNKS